MKNKVSPNTVLFAALSALLVVAVVVLTVMAFARMNQVVPGAGQTPGYVEQPREDAQQSGVPVEQADQPKEEVLPEFSVRPAGRVLTATSADAAFRANVGTCPEAAVMERTVDAGMSWMATDVGQSASSPQRIVSADGMYAALVALSAENCDQLLAAASFDGGNTWQGSPEALEQSWFIDPADTRIHTPVGATLEAPCPAVRLASSGVQNVALICVDGQVFGSEDGGNSWTGTEAMVGIDSLAATEGAYYAAQLGTGECQGTLVTRLAEDLQAAAETCVEQAEAIPGQTAISVSGDGAVWLWAGQATLRSLDGGATWIQ